MLSHKVWGPLVPIHFLEPQPKIVQQHLQPLWEMWDGLARGQKGAAWLPGAQVTTCGNKGN